MNETIKLAQTKFKRGFGWYVELDGECYGQFLMGRHALVWACAQGWQTGYRGMTYNEAGQDTEGYAESLKHVTPFIKSTEKHAKNADIRVYDALPNDAYDKRAPGSWKVVMTWTDRFGMHSQKIAQEVYREDHARKIAAALNAQEVR